MLTRWSLGLSVVVGLVAAAGAAEVEFEKTVLEDVFRSEGVAVADVNKDGKNDVIVGDLWYEAPDWKQHEIRTPRKPERGGYTEAFAVYDGDFNRDGWADIMVIPFHGKDAKWYENPQNKEGHWNERVAFKNTGNETRLFLDLFGDGQKVFLMSVEGKIAWVAVPEDPTQPWPVRTIARDGAGGGIYDHGLGTGDVDGDGRLDVFFKGGWWKQPEKARESSEPWEYFAVTISPDCADMYVFDADEDGLGDIFSTSAHNYGVFWHRQSRDDQGQVKFTTTTLDKQIFETHSLNFADINGDGRKDLVTGQRFGAHGFKDERAPSELFWYELQTKKGEPPTLVAHKVDDQSGVGAQFVTTDINGDGKMDILVSNRKGVFVFEQVK
jgi:hypothetical protein